MLDRSGLEIAIGVTLAAAILLGWLLHALWRRLSPTPASHAGRLAVLARRLHEAEEARDAAIEVRLEAEAALDACAAEHQRAMVEQEDRLTAAAARREAELERALREMTADRDASMDGLRLARAQIAELEAALARPGSPAPAQDREPPQPPAGDAPEAPAGAPDDADQPAAAEPPVPARGAGQTAGKRAKPSRARTSAPRGRASAKRKGGPAAPDER